MALTGSYEAIQPVPRQGKEPETVYVLAASTATYSKGAPASISAAGRATLDADDSASTRFVVRDTVAATAGVTSIALDPLVEGQLWTGILEGTIAESNLGDAVGFDILGATYTTGSVWKNGTNNVGIIVGIDGRFSIGDSGAVVIVKITI